MPEKLYVGFYIRANGDARWHLGQNRQRALCGLGPCDSLHLGKSLWPVHKALKRKNVQMRGCKTCKKIAHGMLDAITQLGNLVHAEG